LELPPPGFELTCLPWQLLQRRLEAKEGPWWLRQDQMVLGFWSINGLLACYLLPFWPIVVGSYLIETRIFF
jgi:hypothetical protein